MGIVRYLWGGVNRDGVERGAQNVAAEAEFCEHGFEWNWVDALEKRAIERELGEEQIGVESAENFEGFAWIYV